jgi:hypothetical protein
MWRSLLSASAFLLDFKIRYIARDNKKTSLNIVTLARGSMVIRMLKKNTKQSPEKELSDDGLDFQGIIRIEKYKPETGLWQPVAVLVDETWTGNASYRFTLSMRPHLHRPWPCVSCRSGSRQVVSCKKQTWEEAKCMNCAYDCQVNQA